MAGKEQQQVLVGGQRLVVRRRLPLRSLRTHTLTARLHPLRTRARTVHTPCCRCRCGTLISRSLSFLRRDCRAVGTWTMQSLAGDRPGWQTKQTDRPASSRNGAAFCCCCFLLLLLGRVKRCVPAWRTSHRSRSCRATRRAVCRRTIRFRCFCARRRVCFDDELCFAGVTACPAVCGHCAPPRSRPAVCLPDSNRASP